MKQQGTQAGRKQRYGRIHFGEQWNENGSPKHRKDMLKRQWYRFTQRRDIFNIIDLFNHHFCDTLFLDNKYHILPSNHSTPTILLILLGSESLPLPYGLADVCFSLSHLYLSNIQISMDTPLRDIRGSCEHFHALLVPLGAMTVYLAAFERSAGGALFAQPSALLSEASAPAQRGCYLRRPCLGRRPLRFLRLKDKPIIILTDTFPNHINR